MEAWFCSNRHITLLKVTIYTVLSGFWSRIVNKPLLFILYDCSCLCNSISWWRICSGVEKVLYYVPSIAKGFQKVRNISLNNDLEEIPLSCRRFFDELLRYLWFEIRWKIPFQSYSIHIHVFSIIYVEISTSQRLYWHFLFWSLVRCKREYFLSLKSLLRYYLNGLRRSEMVPKHFGAHCTTNDFVTETCLLVQALEVDKKPGIALKFVSMYLSGLVMTRKTKT